MPLSASARIKVGEIAQSNLKGKAMEEALAKSLNEVPTEAEVTQKYPASK